jgi:hypothetical protein
MGKVLQIRVSAQTHDPDDVYRHWPRLSRLAWGERQFTADTVKGVRELVAALHDLWKFGNEWSPADQEAVGRALPVLRDLDARLAEALADRRPGDADALSYKIEDSLDALEHATD